MPQILPIGLSYVFANDPILWLSSSLRFSSESLKMVVGSLLNDLPYYKNKISLLNAGLKTKIQQCPVGVLSPLRILFCGSNEGARDVAIELKKECMGSVAIHDMSDLQIHDEDTNTVMLLYLNKSAFCDPTKCLLENVKCSIKAGIQVILVHEMDASCGGCPFADIIIQTPQVLIGEPYNLYTQNIAISLYSMTGFRIVSLRKILHKMGAKSTRTTQVIASTVQRRMSLISLHRLERHNLNDFLAENNNIWWK